MTGATCGLCGDGIVPDYPARPDIYVHRSTGEQDCPSGSLPEPAHLARGVDYLVAQLCAARKADAEGGSRHLDAKASRQMVTAVDTPGPSTVLVDGSAVRCLTAGTETRLQSTAQRGTVIAAQHWQEGSVE